MISLKEILEKNLTGTQLGMKRIHKSKFVYICILSIPLILLLLIFSFSISTVHHKHHNLICSTHDFIIVAKNSSRLSVFVTCNVIIITIFLGSALKSSAGDSDKLFSLFPSVHEVVDAIEKGNDGESDTDYDDDDEEEEEEEFHGYDGYDEDNDDDINAEDADSEDEIDSSDLQMKIEEFIDKAYKTWKEEMVAERLLGIEATEFN